MLWRKVIWLKHTARNLLSWTFLPFCLNLNDAFFMTKAKFHFWNCKLSLCPSYLFSSLLPQIFPLASSIGLHLEFIFFNYLYRFRVFLWGLDKGLHMSLRLSTSIMLFWLLGASTNCITA